MKEFKRMKAAVIGCGMISEIYLKNLLSFDAIDLVGCSDLDPEKSAHRAEQFGIRQMTNEEIFSDPGIGLVVNLTWPLAHYEVSRAALLAGKHVYCEKMQTETVAEGKELLSLAKEKNLFLGGAPDTFLAGGMQTARAILDSGMIGRPTSVSAYMSRDYHQERTYQIPRRFSFLRHGGIIYDMGCYYLTAMIFLLGSVDTVCGFSETVDAHRVYAKPGEFYGQPFEIESPNCTVGSLRFSSGVLGSVTMTSAGGGEGNHFVVNCTDGYLDLGDPNLYNASVTLHTKTGEVSRIPSVFGFSDSEKRSNFRGIGALDAVYALKNGRTPRCPGELGLHVLDIARGITESAASGGFYKTQTTVTRPAPLLPGYTEYPEMVFDI